MTDFSNPLFRQLFFEVYDHLPRGGPGDTASTLKAFRQLTLPPQPFIVDVACGPGMQTIDLANASQAHILAFDNHKTYVANLQVKIKQAGLTDRVQVEYGDLFKMNFAEKSVDLFWCEGALYFLGFEKALRNWQPFLKPGGYLVATEAVWLKPDPPQEVKQNWADEYPAMTDIATCLTIIDQAGYRLINHFTLPESAWWEHFYAPMEARLIQLRGQYRHHPEALDILAQLEVEVRLYEKYSDWFGYEFFICQQPHQG